MDIDLGYDDPPEKKREEEYDNIPVIPPIPRNGGPLDTNPPVAKCGECGKIWHMVEYYSCPHFLCPVQRKATL